MKTHTTENLQITIKTRYDILFTSIYMVVFLDELVIFVENFEPIPAYSHLTFSSFTSYLKKILIFIKNIYKRADYFRSKENIL